MNNITNIGNKKLWPSFTKIYKGKIYIKVYNRQIVSFDNRNINTVILCRNIKYNTLNVEILCGKPYWHFFCNYTAPC